MITVSAGRTFLKAYNKENKKNLSAKEFFEQEYFKLFFNHPKYMQWPTNSPFVQMKKGQKPHLLKHDERQEKLANHHAKIAHGEKDASIAIGFPASEEKEFATTSGLVTDIDISFDEEEIYLSWIGSGLSIGVSGGFAILFDQPEVLLTTFEGWKVYRRFLNDPSLEKLAPNKITSWNGQWLSYAYSDDFRDSFDYASLDDSGFFKLTKTDIVIETIKWSKLFFNLSQQFPNHTLTGYVFSFGQMNKTLGFYPFRFQQAVKLISFYKKLFGESAALKDARFYESIYGLHFRGACELGAIGIQSLEPEGLRKYFNAERLPNLAKSKITKKKKESDFDFKKRKTEADHKEYENKIVPFRIYKTWLIAMITKNKEELSDYTQQVAKTLIEYSAASRKEKAGSTKASNTIKNLLSAKSKKAFLETLTEIVKDDNLENKHLDTLMELRNEIHFLNDNDFGYFVVLLKFDYAYQKRTY